MNSEPQEEHRWLQQLVGEWTYEHESICESGKPPRKFRGTESVRPLGDIWVLCEGRGEMPGGGMATMQMTLGYDPQKEGFVGTWIGSMMTWLWIYEGSLDPDKTILTLHSQGPAFSSQRKIVKYKDVIEIRSDDHRVMSSHALDDNGNWLQFMTANYRRQK